MVITVKTGTGLHGLITWTFTKQILLYQSTPYIICKLTKNEQNMSPWCRFWSAYQCTARLSKQGWGGQICSSSSIQ